MIGSPPHSPDPSPTLQGGEGRPLPRGARAWGRRDLAVAWHLPLLAGLLPILVIGFGASALANRLVFAGWGLAAGAAYTALLRVGLDRGWNGWARGTLLTTTLAVAFTALAGLVARHQQILDLGFRAVAPKLYLTAVSRAEAALSVAAFFALAAVWSGSVWWVRRLRKRLMAGGRSR